MDDGVLGGSAPAPVRVRAKRAAKVRGSAGVRAAVVVGTRAGLVLKEVCAAPGMPSVRAVVGWSRKDPAFAAELRAAREAAGLGVQGGARSSYCAETAEAICARLCLGEAMVSILRDVEMPGYSTVFGWLAEIPEFRAAVALARDIQGLRLAELGWEDACSVTPETAYALRVKLEHLRWYAGKLAPRKYGALAPLPPEGFGWADAAPDAREPPKLQISVTRFKVSPGGEVMALPPRSETDLALYREIYGREYDGPME
jgi:hypothetical protein